MTAVAKIAPTTSPATLDALPALTSDELVTVAGGAGFDFGQLAGTIGGLVDQFAGTGGKASQIASQVGPLINNLIGSFGSGAGAGAAGGGAS